MSDLFNLTPDLNTLLHALPSIGALSLIVLTGWTAFRTVRGVFGLGAGIIRGGLELLALAVPGSVRPTPAIASYAAAASLLSGGAGLAGYGQGGTLGAMTGAGIAAAVTAVFLAVRTIAMHDSHTLALQQKERTGT